MTKRVLICDDSMLMRKMIADCLMCDEWEIAGEAADGREAVEKFRETQPDVVTMDIVMPGYDGLYGLETIMQENPRAHVIVVSALNQTAMISQAIRKGAYDFIVKPFLPEQLQKTLQRAYDSAVQENVMA